MLLADIYSSKYQQLLQYLFESSQYQSCSKIITIKEDLAILAIAFL